ncbi:hypothetical protein [Vibrio parahaemolyticus]|uniref:hypothetical protein n=1 Tax=Vibrio parahaemolyticus TaxID=670 RepID=UPI0004D4C1B8|nr:hypothetical protein [Vibrio parahaemolyticus]ANQ58808.1 hypothetical protein AB831_21900 [Vibrio parahaemolyticus]EGQ7716644.1 hypothetical protein [Vibrio parahaemolyticus]EGQ7721722.1 hypothetical protein [Vibrio parahaemolyticus]EGQ7726107.1 hypothetical protein [Vibrio parahaemolyticus]EGQ7730899.1 hypothetical protein [Vibrio parahaemolyticus]
MPLKTLHTSSEAKKHYKSVSYETLLASWLLQDGWEVFMPMIDHGMKTDVLISDGSKFYRIQVKSVECFDENTVVTDQWQDAQIDYVIYFSRCANWGYIAPPFNGKRRVNHIEHVRFHQHPKNFLKAFGRA